MRLNLASFSLLMLGGCVSSEAPKLAAPTPPPPLPKVAVVECSKIPLEEYSASSQKQAAAEMKILSIESQVATYVVDYGELRSKIRQECKK
jgi:hypothetical protein